MTDEEMLACATTFTLIKRDNHRPAGHIRELHVEWRGDDAWAIVDPGFNLNHEGDWEWEPRPSSRDDEFFARCRWPSAREAITFAEEHLRKYPSGTR